MASPQKSDSKVTVVGALIDSPEEILAALDLTDGRLSAADDARIVALLEKIGYRARIERRGVKVRLHLKLYPVVRRIYIKGNNWPLMPLFEDEILRRLRFRPGQRLPDGPELARILARQEGRMQRFLAREGFFEGSLRIRCRGKNNNWGKCTPLPVDAKGRVDLQVRIFKGRSYKLGPVKVARSRSGATSDSSELGGPDLSGAPEVLSDSEIAKTFKHRVARILWRSSFDTERFKKDVERLKKRYHKLGYPGVRIKESFTVDPCVPSSRAVRIKLRVDPRKRVVVKYKGNDNLKPKELDEVLTIFEASAYDDYELAQSARQLHMLYQREGYLQARVRFERRRVDPDTDEVTFHVQEGPRFRVKRVTFHGNKRIDADDLQKQLRTRPFPLLGYVGLGEGGYVTDKQLKQDEGRLAAYYRSLGFPNARVSGEVAPHPALIDRPGALAASVSVGKHDEDGEAHVRFTIHEGPRVVIHQVMVHAAVNENLTGLGDLGTGDVEPPAKDDASPARGKGKEVVERARRGGPLARRAKSSTIDGKLTFSDAQLLKRLSKIGLKPGDHFTPAKIKRGKEALLAFYAERGYPYAEVGSFESVNSTGTLVDLHFTVQEDKLVRIGSIFIRGNFKTRPGTITDALGFSSGDRFDIRERAAAERRLRRLKIFNTVRIRLLGLSRKPSHVPVLVHVEERYDDYGALEFAVGGSTDNLVFAAMGYKNSNLFGFGTSLELRGELGLEIRSLNARYTDPQLFGSLFTFDTTGFWRQEITERLGDITTFGTTVTVSRELLPRLQGFMRYEIRRVKHQEDFNRPAVGRDEASRVDVFTTTAGVGPALVYDRRDNPLSPTSGFRLAVSALWASLYLGGSDEFIKLNAGGQAYLPLPLDITIAFGVRYDHGFPLRGNVLLPKVERFFAGGDTTIRGFEEDRAFAERIALPTVPFDGMTITRAVPQGGNIRLLTNVEIQFPIWKESLILGRDLLFAVFSDNGVVLNSFEAFEWEEFRHSVGFALRIVLPVGFASFEVGFPLDPAPGDPSDGWRFHFNFGFIL